jgi:hypothetical protein
VAARSTDSQPFFAAALVSYASPVATTWPLLAFQPEPELAGAVLVYLELACHDASPDEQ